MAVVTENLSETVRHLTGWKHVLAVGRAAYHRHGSFEMVYHQSGRGTVLLEGRQEIGFRGGSVEIVPSALRHAQQQLARGVDCCIYFDPSPPLAARLSAGIALVLNAGEYPAREVVALAAKPSPQHAVEQRIYDLRLTAVVLHLLDRSGQAAEVMPPVALRAQLALQAYEYVRLNWREIRRIRQVADHVGVSPDYLRHLFTAHYGHTVHDLLTRMRIEYAQDLLRNSHLPQKVLAALCGFAEIQQFSRRFRQVTGMTAGEYRQRQRRAGEGM
ncbi:MAG: helix-turn-helix transcriptional regulator [Phycisphaerae bacterium]